MGILTVALLGLLGVFISGLKMVQASAGVTAATNIGREFLETVKMRGYGATTVGVFDGRIPTPPDSLSNFPFAPYPVATIDSQSYPLVVRCSDYTPTIRSVSVDVYWRPESKTTLRTLIHQ